MTSTFDITEFLLLIEDVSPKTIRKLLLTKYSPEILENTAKKYGFQTIDDLITDVKNRVAFKANNTEQYDPKTQELYKLMMFLIENKERIDLTLLNYYGIAQTMQYSDEILKTPVENIKTLLNNVKKITQFTDFALLNGLYSNNRVNMVYEDEKVWIYEIKDPEDVCIYNLGAGTNWCVARGTQEPAEPDLLAAKEMFHRYTSGNVPFFIVYPKTKQILEKTSGSYKKFALRFRIHEFDYDKIINSDISRLSVFAASKDKARFYEFLRSALQKSLEKVYYESFKNFDKNYHYTNAMDALKTFLFKENSIILEHFFHLIKYIYRVNSPESDLSSDRPEENYKDYFKNIKFNYNIPNAYEIAMKIIIKRLDFVLTCKNLFFEFLEYQKKHPYEKFEDKLTVDNYIHADTGYTTLRRIKKLLKEAVIKALIQNNDIDANKIDDFMEIMYYYKMSSPYENNINERSLKTAKESLERFIEFFNFSDFKNIYLSSIERVDDFIYNVITPIMDYEGTNFLNDERISMLYKKKPS